MINRKQIQKIVDFVQKDGKANLAAKKVAGSSPTRAVDKKVDVAAVSKDRLSKTIKQVQRLNFG